MTTQTEHLYIVRDDRILSGEPIIKGTRTPVRAIVENWRMGIAPEEIPLHLPHLTLATRSLVEALPRIARRVYEVLPLTAVLERAAVVDTSSGEVHPLARLV